MFAALACALATQNENSGTGDARPVLGAERPSIVLLAPQTGEKYALNAPVLLYAEARDSGAGVARIEFYDNFGELIDTVAASNPQGDATLSGIVSWTPPGAQRYFVSAKAFRADGTESNGQEASFEVIALDGSTSSIQPPPDAGQAQLPQESDQQQAPPPDQQQQEQNPVIQEPPQQNQADSGTTGDAGGVTAIVTAEVLNVRVAPGVRADIARAPLTTGESVQLIGRSEDGLWYAIPLSTGTTGWIFGESLQINGDPGTLPLATVQ